MLLVGMLGMVLTFGTLTGCMSMVGVNSPPAVVDVFSSKIPEEMQTKMLGSYKVWFGVFATPESKVKFESKLKGLQENKDYYIVVSQGILSSVISAVSR